MDLSTGIDEGMQLYNTTWEGVLGIKAYKLDFRCQNHHLYRRCTARDTLYESIGVIIHQYISPYHPTASCPLILGSGSVSALPPLAFPFPNSNAVSSVFEL